MNDAFLPPAGPRIRLISDNDYAGDPDGLYQLVHHLLSPSVELRAIISSHLAPDDPFDNSGHSAAHGADAARHILDLTNLSNAVPVIAGSETAITHTRTARPTPAAQSIIDEAMRTDTDRPLFLTLGAGLTELATAYLMEPRIADHLTAVWIGGPEHVNLGATPPPGAAGVEYNLNIDIAAGQVVFNSPIPLWQVPRDSYRRALVSMIELAVHVQPCGELGKHLFKSLAQVHTMTARFSHNLGETYILGDNPLVLLTALMSQFEMDPSSSSYHCIPRPQLSSDGQYIANKSGHPMRVYHHLDQRLMIEDLYAKLLLFADRLEGPQIKG